jgi:hypothetical protein
MDPISYGLGRRNTADLADMAQYLSTPVATYTHTANTEIVVTAVDVDTDTFTVAGAAPADGTRLSPVLNYDAGNVYPVNVYPGGISFLSAQYYVVNSSGSTFKLSLTSGGAAVNLTVNAAMDLTKWHFETNTVDVTISGLPNLPKCRILLRGRSVIDVAGSGVILVNAITSTQEWLVNGQNSFYYPTFAIQADVNYNVEFFIDYTRYLSMRGRGLNVKSNTASANTVSVIDKLMVSPKYRESTIQSITIGAIQIANNSKIEVYRA